MVFNNVVSVKFLCKNLAPAEKTRRDFLYRCWVRRAKIRNFGIYLAAALHQERNGESEKFNSNFIKYK